ncbi:MAG: GNAT family N-acetyltransferase [Clostridiales bacterium]|nr:GNAT family N-acetyltransferase [Clostridiales bacterium]
MVIELGEEKDIDNWMNLVNKVKENFPGLEAPEALNRHKNTVFEFMNKKSAICAKINNKIIGEMLFSKETNEICFLVVKPEYRRQHIAEKMFMYMLTLINSKKDIIVTTYRAEAPEGISARKFYKKMGFAEGKLKEEFSSKVQEFVLKR